jgi:hypothetical protein
MLIFFYGVPKRLKTFRFDCGGKSSIFVYVALVKRGHETAEELARWSVKIK